MTDWKTRFPIGWPPGLAGKLALSLVFSLAAILLVFSVLNLRLQRRQSEDLVLRSGLRVTDLIQRSTRYQMLHNDRAALDQALQDIGEEDGISHVRLFNREGVVRFSTGKGGDAPAAPTIDQQNLKPVWRILPSTMGRQLNVVRPIPNEASCSNAACHAHPAGHKVLGVIDAHLSLAEVDAQIAEHQSLLARFSVAAIGVLCVVSLLFIWRVVYRPVQALQKGTARVASGDLGYRIPETSGDELGALAHSFNHMTGELQEAREEITAWTRTLEQRVEAKTRELERAHRSLAATETMASLGKISAAVAHEVNNPLFGILTYARLALRDNENAAGQEKTVERLRVIERESKRCGDIIRNLLNFARPQKPSRQPTDLVALADHSLALLKHQFELQSISVERSFPADFPAVRCDQAQIQQVFVALLVNAGEAMRPNAGAVRIAAECKGDEVDIRISDTGPGIPDLVLPHIFEPFYTTKAETQGTGLGLAVARSIVEQHGGSLTAANRPEGGAEFLIRLPVAPPDLPPDGAPNSERSAFEEAFHGKQ